LSDSLPIEDDLSDISVQILLASTPCPASPTHAGMTADQARQAELSLIIYRYLFLGVRWICRRAMSEYREYRQYRASKLSRPGATATPGP
jgi:hypothetical protein